MHTLTSSFFLAYHGCEKSVAEKVLSGKGQLSPSKNKYDWLGSGTYFWEANPLRAFQWAKETGKKEPFVVGAVINPGNCLDLFSSNSIVFVQDAYEQFIDNAKSLGMQIPQNKGGKDKLRRNLDCAVINYLHAMLAQMKQPPIDTVRGGFFEGGEAYKGSEFQKESHIQWCVCNPKMIKAAFRVRDEDFILPK